MTPLRKANVAGTRRVMRRMAQNGAAEAGRTMQTVLKLIFYPSTIY